MYEYRAYVNKIVDGDTVDVDIDLGFGIKLTDERVRVMGIDTPESRTSNDLEKIFGLASKHRVQELLGEVAILKTQIDKSGEDMKGKFGRILGDFIVQKDGKDRLLSEVLIEEGHAVAYFGESKDDVQGQHAINRARLIAEGIVSAEEVKAAEGK